MQFNPIFLLKNDNSFHIFTFELILRERDQPLSNSLHNCTHYLQHINSITKVKLTSIQKKTHVCNSKQTFFSKMIIRIQNLILHLQTSYDLEDKPGTFVSPRSTP